MTSRKDLSLRETALLFAVHFTRNGESWGWKFDHFYSNGKGVVSIVPIKSPWYFDLYHKLTCHNWGSDVTQ